jgi:hypothetical protein
VAQGVREVNTSQRPVVVIVLTVVLFVVAGLVVSATQGTSTQGKRGRPSTGGVPASVAVLPGLAAAGVAAVAIVANNRRERERLHEEAHREIALQDHERELKRVELEGQRQSRLRDERIRVYSEFRARWEANERAQNTLYIGPDRTEVEDARWQFQSSFNALSLLAPEEVRAAADALLKWSEQDPPDRDPAVPGRFWKAARKDLDIPLTVSTGRPGNEGRN